MAVPLLQTKLFAPSISGLVSRPHLIQKLEAGRKAGHRLVLISAAAGSGKTSLLSEWASRTGQNQGAASTGNRFAWLSLDGDDNDPHRFWRYFLAAFQKVQPIKVSISQLLESPQPPPFQTVLTLLLNELAAQSEPLILVLDDYHTISNAEIHTGITFWLEHAPAQVHLVLATRADPPLPIFRWRARNQLTEIREADLRFSEAEADLFIKKEGLDLTEKDIQALEERTEGWIAGLQLAALALKAPRANQDQGFSHELITAFSGSHQYILEYLVEEVLSRQDPIVQDFLIRTSILSRLCGPLCDSIMGWEQEGEDRSSETRSSGQGMLEYLEHANLFTLSIDQEHHWYRYHHLFSDLLANRLRQALPANIVRELHCRASDWLAGHNFLDEAIQQALIGKDGERAAAIAEKAARSLMFSGQANTLRDWLKLLPDESLQSHPRLKIYQIWIDVMQAKLALTDEVIKDIDAMLEGLPASPENDALRGEWMVTICRILAVMGKPSGAIRLAQEALAYFPEEDQASRARAYSALCIAYGMEGQIEKSETAYNECIRLALASHYYSLAAHTAWYLGQGFCMYGRMHQAERLYQDIIEWGAQSGQENFFPAGQGYLGLASIHLERNELKTAEDYLERGIDLCKQGGLDGVFSGILLRARLRQARGDFESALGEIHFLEQNFPKSDSPGKLVREFQIRLALGDAACASLLAGPLVYVLNLPEDKSGLPVVAREILQVLLARMFLAQGNLEQAHRLLGECQATAEPGKRFGHLIEVYLLRALAFQKQNNGVPTSQAVDVFTGALELAEPEGYVMLFLEEGQAVISLLQAIVSGQAGYFSNSISERLQAYARKLLSNFPDIHPTQNYRASQPDAAAQPAGTLQSESLSQRELEILQLICDGCSNQEIAEKLVISLHTVKKHTSNIFAKLGVSSRTQAAARGHQLNLL